MGIQKLKWIRFDVKIHPNCLPMVSDKSIFIYLQCLIGIFLSEIKHFV